MASDETLGAANPETGRGMKTTLNVPLDFRITLHISYFKTKAKNINALGSDYQGGIT